MSRLICRRRGRSSNPGFPILQAPCRRRQVATQSCRISVLRAAGQALAALHEAGCRGTVTVHSVGMHAPLLMRREGDSTRKASVLKTLCGSIGTRQWRPCSADNLVICRAHRSNFGVPGFRALDQTAPLTGLRKKQRPTVPMRLNWPKIARTRNGRQEPVTGSAKRRLVLLEVTKQCPKFVRSMTQQLPQEAESLGLQEAHGRG